MVDPSTSVATPLPPPTHQQLQPQSHVGPHHLVAPEKNLDAIVSMEPEQLVALRRRLQVISAAGHTKENSSEYAKLALVMEYHARHKMMAEKKGSLPEPNGAVTNGESSDPKRELPSPKIGIT